MASMDGSVSKINSAVLPYAESKAIPPPSRKTTADAPKREPAGERAKAAGVSTDAATNLATVAEKLKENLESAETPVVEQSIREANQAMAGENRSMRFRVNRDYGEIQVQIVDSSRDKVIRSIPADEMMRLASRMRELSGVGAMVDESR